MGYNTNGYSHTSGIKNEEKLRDYLQRGAAKQLYPQLSSSYEVLKRGGTKFKQDMEIQDKSGVILISAKKKDVIEKGSFDWLNSSAALSESEVLSEFARKISDIPNVEDVYGPAKLEGFIASMDALRNLPSSDLSKILKKHINQKNKNMKIMITESLGGRNWEYSFIESPLYHAIENYTPVICLGRGIESASVEFETPAGNRVDLGLRIRLTTNNGIGALLGQSKSNKSARAVVKFQQDDIPGLIAGLGNKIRTF